jgi:transmembrane sensor
MKGMNHHTARIAAEAAEWLIRLEEDSSPGCRQEFASWLKHSPSHMDEFLLVTSVYRAMGGADPERKIDPIRLMQESEPPIVPLSGDADPIQPGNPRRKRLVVSSLAAAAVFLSMLLWWGVPRTTGTDSTYATTLGEQRSVKLPDGSIVFLNTKSRIRTAFSGAAREVHQLEGEALFVVERDPQRPFRVLAGSTVVQALGTQFNVYRRGESVEVSVIEGRVEVSSGAVPAPLNAGEEAHVSHSGRITTQPAEDVARAVAWRQRQLIFQSRPLGEIAEEFNRYNSMQLSVEGGTLAQRRVTGVFDADRPEALLKFLRTDPALEVEQQGSAIVIRAARPDQQSRAR